MIPYVLFFIVILGWSLPAFVTKDLTTYLDNIEIFIYYHLLFNVFILGYIIYILIYRRDKAIAFGKSCIKIPKRLILITIGIVILILVGRIAYYELLRHLDVNTIVPIIRGGSTIIIILVGYLCYQEKISLLKLVGIFTVLLGIYMVNKF